MPGAEALTVLTKWASSHPYIWAFVVVWSLAWKGFGLWKAAERGQKYWFIAILVLNTLGILEIFYIFVIARRYKVEVVNS